MKTLKQMIANDLGLSEKSNVNESYVTAAQSYDLPTELLSEKTKSEHQKLLKKYVDSLNTVAAKLDTADREKANPNHSEYRSLKNDEVFNLNSSFLHALYFENISDLTSVITMDSMSFLRIERDFGSFDDWQKDFIASALSSRGGWAVMSYNIFLGRYINTPVDSHNINIPFSSIPIVVMNVGEHAYYKDYLSDRKTYVYAMMKELNWDVIEKRVKKAEKIAKIMGK